MVEFLKKKYGFTDTTFASVGWHYLIPLFKWKPAHQRATLAKYIHGWTPSSDFLCKQRRDAPPCPFCGTSTNTQDHVLQCPDELTMIFRTAEWNKCTTYPVHMVHGCPTMVDIIDMVWQFLHLPPLQHRRAVRSPRVGLQLLIDQATIAQDLIGWDLLLRGFVAVEWEVDDNGSYTKANFMKASFSKVK